LVNNNNKKEIAGVGQDDHWHMVYYEDHWYFWVWGRRMVVVKDQKLRVWWNGGCVARRVSTDLVDENEYRY